MREIHTAVVTFEGESPYSQSKFVQVEKKRGEKHDEYEKRTWMNRMELDDDDEVVLSPMAVKRALEDAAKFSGMTIPGKGKSTYTKRFLAGVMVTKPVKLGAKKDDIVGEWFHVPSDGVRGGGKRVMKCFPMVKDWGGTVEITVLDEAITEDVMKEFCEIAARFIGFGRFRPQNGGFYGRFKITDFKWD